MNDHQSVTTLCEEWIQYKIQETEANKRRLEIEQQICQLAKEALPTQGTATLGNVKVTTGFTRTWDATRLTAIYRNKPPVFPFKIDWKENRRLTTELETSQPEVMSLYADALTIKEKKPSFAYIG